MTFLFFVWLGEGGGSRSARKRSPRGSNGVCFPKRGTVGLFMKIASGASFKCLWRVCCVRFAMTSFWPLLAKPVGRSSLTSRAQGGPRVTVQSSASRRRSRGNTLPAHGHHVPRSSQPIAHGHRSHAACIDHAPPPPWLVEGNGWLP